MTHQINEWLREHRITEVECIVPDMTGVARGKIVPKDKFVSDPEMRLPEVVLIQTVTGDYPDDSMLDLTDPDMVLAPDPNTLRFVPWAVDPTAQLIYDCLRADGGPVDVAPRNVLKRVIGLFDEMGLEPVLAPEMEFYLLSPTRTRTSRWPRRWGAPAAPSSAAARIPSTRSTSSTRCSRTSMTTATRRIWKWTP